MKPRPICGQKCPEFQFLRKSYMKNMIYFLLGNEIYQKLMRVHMFKQNSAVASRNPQWRTKVNENVHFVFHFAQYH